MRLFASSAFLMMSLIPSLGLAEGKSVMERCKAQEVYWQSQNEAPSMDPTKQVDSVSHMWLGHIYEGLTTSDAKGKVVPGAAESFTVSPDGKTYTFKLRKNAKWHDGKPVVAADFEYAFRRLVDPTYASQYSFFAMTAKILNAAAIIEKKMPPSELGVKAVDDHTFEIKLDGPNPLIPELVKFQVFFPIRKDIVERDKEAFNTKVEGVIGNGPYKLTEWIRDQKMRVVKADTYWNAKAIKITAIETPVILKDTAAIYNQFVSSGIDFILRLDKDRIKLAQKDNRKLLSYQAGTHFYMEFNSRPGKLFSNVKLRQAVRVGINRNEFVNKIVGTPGQKPAYGLVPDYIPGAKGSYRSEAPLKFKDNDVALAKKYIAEYLAETKATKVPEFTILAGDTSRAKEEAEYFQAVLSKLFDTTVKIESVPFKTRLQKMRDAQFDMVLAGWGPDYMDPMTFMDLFTSTNENNHGGYNNPKYDELIAKAGVEMDPVKRVKIFQEAEKLLIEVDAPVVANQFEARSYLVTPGLNGVVRSIVGSDPDFRFASWGDCSQVK